MNMNPSRKTAFDRVRSAVATIGLRIQDAGANQFSAQCPAHDDRYPSLSVTGIEGQAMLYCHAGCDTRDVVAALKLTMSDLFDEPRGASYRYSDGREVHRSPEKSFRQSGNTTGTALYRAERLAAAVSAGNVVYVVEGEKDVHAIEALGGVACCSAMGAGKARKFDWSPLKGADVVIVYDKDPAGSRHAADVFQLVSSAGARKVSFATALVGNDAADHVASGAELADLVPTPSVNISPEAASLRASWDDPTPLGLSSEPVELPHGNYPRALWDMVDAEAEFRQVPRSAVFLSALAVASGAAGGRCEIGITGGRSGMGYTEQLSIYTGVALPPGERKSGTHADVRRPLSEVQKELSQRMAVDEESKAIVRTGIERELEEKEEEAAKIDPKNEDARRTAAQEINKIKERLAAVEANPVQVRMVSDDITAEKLCEKMFQQGGRQIMLAAEGKIFAIMAGQYSSGPNFDIYLRAHAGDEFLAERKGNAEPYHLTRPVLNMSVMFQPAILAEMGKTPTLKELGLTARFFLDVPTPMAGYRKDISEVTPIPEHVRDGWTDAIRGIANELYMLDEPRVLPLSPEAEELHKPFRKEAEHALRPDGDMYLIREWGSKLPGGIARVAGVFQLLENPCATEVSGEAMRAAIDLVPWFKYSSTRALNVISGSTASEGTKAVLKALRKRAHDLAGTTMTARQVYRLRGIGDKAYAMPDVRGALETLADHGYVAPTGMRDEYMIHPRMAEFSL